MGSVEELYSERLQRLCRMEQAQGMHRVRTLVELQMESSVFGRASLRELLGRVDKLIENHEAIDRRQG